MRHTQHQAGRDSISTTYRLSWAWSSCETESPLFIAFSIDFDAYSGLACSTPHGVTNDENTEPREKQTAPHTTNDAASPRLNPSSYRRTGAITPDVDAEAQKDRVDGEAQHVHERRGDGVCHEHREQDGHPERVQLLLALGVRRVVVNPHEDEEAARAHDEELAQHEQEGRDDVEHAHLRQVADQELHRLHGGGAERLALHGDHDVSGRGHVLDALFEQPQAAGQALEQVLHKHVGVLQLLALAVQVREDGTNELHDGDDHGAKRDGTQVLGHGGTNGLKHRHLVRVALVGAEVADAHGTSNAHGEETLDEVRGPQQAEEVVQQEVVVDRLGIEGSGGVQADTRSGVNVAASILGAQQVLSGGVVDDGSGVESHVGGGDVTVGVDVASHGDPVRQQNQHQQYGKEL